MHKSLKSNNNSNSSNNFLNTVMPESNYWAISSNFLWSFLQLTNMSQYSFWDNIGPFSSQKKGRPLWTRGLNIGAKSLACLHANLHFASTIFKWSCLWTTFLAIVRIEILSWMFPHLMSSSIKLFRKLITPSVASKGFLCMSNLAVWMCFLASCMVASLSWIKSKYGRTLFASAIILSQMRCFSPI